MNTPQNFTDFFDFKKFEEAFTALKRSQKKSRFEHEYYSGYITIKAFEEDLQGNFSRIKNSLIQRSFKFSRLHPVLLAREGKAGYRMICIPTVQDRVVQKILISYLQQTDQLLSSETVDFSQSKKDVKKELRGTTGARRLASSLRKKYPYALKTDISAFFDNINRAQLIKKIRSTVSADDACYLLESAIRCNTRPITFSDPVKNDLVRSKMNKGVRQGMPLSSLLASFYLSEFDQYMQKKRLRVVRYADDLLILTKSEKDSLRAFNIAKEKLLEAELTLPPLEDNGKSQIYKPKETIRFLGMDMVYDDSLKSFSWCIPPDTIEAIKKDLLTFTDIPKNLEQGIDLTTVLKKIDYTINGYLACFRDDISQSQIEDFESKMISHREKILTELLGKLGVDLPNLSPANKKFLLGLSKEEIAANQNKTKNGNRSA